MERRRKYRDNYLPPSNGVAGYIARGDLVDRRGSANDSLLGGLDSESVGSEEGRSAMLSPARIRSIDRWPVSGCADPCINTEDVVHSKGLQGTKEGKQDMIAERRPATTIGELDIHLGFLMEELREMRAQQQEMIQNLATKAEVAIQIADLRQQIVENSPRSFWKRITEMAVGVVAVCTAVGFLVAVFRFLKL